MREPWGPSSINAHRAQQGRRRRPRDAWPGTDRSSRIPPWRDLRRPCGAAAAAWPALVAGQIGLGTKVRTPGALQQIAAHRGHVAQLRRRALLQRLRDGGVILPHAVMLRHVAHARQRPNRQAGRRDVDLLQPRQAVDVDHAPRGDDALLQPVDELRASGNQAVSWSAAAVVASPSVVAWAKAKGCMIRSPRSCGLDCRPDLG